VSLDSDLDDLLARAWRTARWVPSEMTSRARFRASPDVRRSIVMSMERWVIPPISWQGEERLFGLLFVSDVTMPDWTLRLEVDA